MQFMHRLLLGVCVLTAIQAVRYSPTRSGNPVFSIGYRSHGQAGE